MSSNYPSYYRNLATFLSLQNIYWPFFDKTLDSLQKLRKNLPYLFWGCTKFVPPEARSRQEAERLSDVELADQVRPSKFWLYSLFFWLRQLDNKRIHDEVVLLRYAKKVVKARFRKGKSRTGFPKKCSRFLKNFHPIHNLHKNPLCGKY